MIPSVVIIQTPNVDFDTLLSLGNKMLGYSLSAQVDASRKHHHDASRFISCLAAIRESGATPGLTPSLLNFVSMSVLIASEERDLLDILEATGGMPFVKAETVSRGIFMAVVSGTMAQWRDAVKTATSLATERNVRYCYCKIKEQFDQAGLGDIWKDYSPCPLNDGTFRLDDKRR